MKHRSTWSVVASVVANAICSASCTPRSGPEPVIPAVPDHGPPRAQPAPAPAPPPRPPRPSPAPAPPPLVTCMRGDGVESFARRGEAASTAIGCMDRADPARRSCWRIDARGAATPLPRAEWPAPGPPDHLGDGTPRIELGLVAVRAPAGIAVTIEADDESLAPPSKAPRTIEVCDAGRCKRLAVPRPAAPVADYLRFLNVLPDRRTLVLGYGLTAAAEAIHLHDLDRPAARPRPLPIPKRQCAIVLDELGGHLLVQRSDCANDGGERVLVTRAGARLASLGFHSRHDSYFRIGGDRWLFTSHGQGLAIWDVAKRRRVAASASTAGQIQRHVAVLDGTIVELTDDGKLVAYDAALAPRPLGELPRCP